MAKKFSFDGSGRKVPKGAKVCGKCERQYHFKGEACLANKSKKFASKSGLNQVSAKTLERFSKLDKSPPLGVADAMDKLKDLSVPPAPPEIRRYNYHPVTPNVALVSPGSMTEERYDAWLKQLNIEAKPYSGSRLIDSHGEEVQLISQKKTTPDGSMKIVYLNSKGNVEVVQASVTRGVEISEYGLDREKNKTVDWVPGPQIFESSGGEGWHINGVRQSHSDPSYRPDWLPKPEGD